MKLSDLLNELEQDAKDDSRAALTKNQGSKMRKKLENRAEGVIYTVEKIKHIMKREILIKMVAK